MSIQEMWAKSTTARTLPGRDLYVRPMTVAEMSAPLSWHEKQLAIVYRYGQLSDGSIGNLRIDNRKSK